MGSGGPARGDHVIRTARQLKSRSASGRRFTRTNGVNLLLMTRFKALGTAETERVA